MENYPLQCKIVALKIVTEDIDLSKNGKKNKDLLFDIQYNPE